MKKKQYKDYGNIKCDNCGYCNNKDYIKYSGVCHLCGKVLDPKAKFKVEMNKKLRLWRNQKPSKWR